MTDESSFLFLGSQMLLQQTKVNRPVTSHCKPNKPLATFSFDEPLKLEEDKKLLG